ncbi:uncharacterized protein LOC120770695 [Bactrocera tryoni]|uniref:uncharacterized protein LOC120770695 n=1 Tax=Bactrocera tryoni TaxID=59916 RepID=UPI001A968A1F|nr:uncharacterized protein LOC120770695 [Bactrocera tryoni]
MSAHFFHLFFFLRAIKGLSLQQMLDFIEELDEAGDQDDVPATIYIEPPVDGNISGEDDAEDESGGIPDNVCPPQLKSECEVVMASGRRLQNFDENEIGGICKYRRFACRYCGKRI